MMLKIISNPYKKETKFQKWDEDDSLWIEINYDNNKNSRLLNSELTGGFFPFRAKRIVDLLIDEYGNAGESLQILFEGSTDEYKELEAVCADENYKERVSIARSGMYLENARDILPDVKELFKEMSPLIIQNEEIQRYLKRFADASSDVVPICVLGNYSAGKSTFINALIGSEILPSGTEPVTAKIYKIFRSKYPDRASIKFEWRDNTIKIHFHEVSTEFDAGLFENELIQEIQDTLEGKERQGIVSRVREVLRILNSFEAESEAPEIADLIEVEIPFSKGVLAGSQHPFVIFDTPGSNSASNARHLKVLKEAMSDMTNGLPIFISTPDALDSTDNESL